VSLFPSQWTVIHAEISDVNDKEVTTYQETTLSSEPFCCDCPQDEACVWMSIAHA
jgi:hypothetical protein